jgi:hypothetical protein
MADLKLSLVYRGLAVATALSALVAVVAAGKKWV